MINQGENNLFICVEDRYYKDKWEDIAFKTFEFLNVNIPSFGGNWK